MQKIQVKMKCVTVALRFSHFSKLMINLWPNINWLILQLYPWLEISPYNWSIYLQIKYSCGPNIICDMQKKGLRTTVLPDRESKIFPSRSTQSFFQKQVLVEKFRAVHFSNFFELFFKILIINLFYHKWNLISLSLNSPEIGISSLPMKFAFHSRISFKSFKTKNLKN